MFSDLCVTVRATLSSCSFLLAKDYHFIYQATRFFFRRIGDIFLPDGDGMLLAPLARCNALKSFIYNVHSTFSLSRGEKHKFSLVQTGRRGEKALKTEGFIPDQSPDHEPFVRTTGCIELELPCFSFHVKLRKSRNFQCH